MIISLTGFMGVGKSTISERLAKMLLCKYIDLDKHIEQEENKTISDIFDKEGEDYFRSLEEVYLNDIIKSNQDNMLVLSLGGGALISQHNQKLVKKNTLCIYLKADIGTMVSRLQKTKKERPHIKDIDQCILETDIIALFKIREPGYCYSQSKTIEVDNKTIQEILSEILDVI